MITLARFPIAPVRYSTKVNVPKQTRTIITKAKKDMFYDTIESQVNNVTKLASKPICDLLEKIDKRLENIENKLSKYETRSDQETVEMVDTIKIREMLDENK